MSGIRIHLQRANIGFQGSDRVLYLISGFVVLIQIAASYLIDNDFFIPFYIASSVLLATLEIAFSSMLWKTPVNPAAIFSVVWHILIPVTSGSAPMMKALSNETVRNLLMGSFSFSVGGIISTIPYEFFGGESKRLGRRIANAAETGNSRNGSSEKTRTIVNALSIAATVVSCLAIVVSLCMNGSIGLFGSDESAKKTVDAFFGYTFISSAGTVSLLIMLYTCRKNWVTALLFVVYIILQLLTGQRWFAIVAIVLAISKMGLINFKKKNWVMLGLLILGIIAAFLFISIFRNSEASFQKYFVDTGRYNGPASDLSNTELIRYIGMSQRNMETVFSRGFDISKCLQFTLTPLLFLVVKPTTLSLHTNIQAYTANNALSYLFSDFGPVWPIAVIVLSILIHYLYRKAREKTSSLTAKVLWGTCVLGLSLSFFSYVNAYFYWILIYPLMIWIAENCLNHWILKSPRRRPN